METTPGCILSNQHIHPERGVGSPSGGRVPYMCPLSLTVSTKYFLQLHIFKTEEFFFSQILFLCHSSNYCIGF